MRSYNHFTLEERENLRIQKEQGKSMRQIAREMHRDVSSISRELKRNGNKDGTYNAWRGCSLYLWRRKSCRRTYRIAEDDELREFILKGLDQYWSPEIIAAKWNEKRLTGRISHSTIYTAIKRKLFVGYSEKSHLRRRGLRKYRKGNNKTIHPEHRIHERPDIIVQRGRVGDWEGDTVLGGINKGGIFTCVDRKSRYLVVAGIKNKTAAEMELAMCESLKNSPVHSITLDNGSEFANFKRIEKAIKTTIYFADPHSPWQRGSNENINGLLRWFFPKGCDFRQVSEERLCFVSNLINNRPRKCLGWLSPADLFNCCN